MMRSLISVTGALLLGVMLLTACGGPEAEQSVEDRILARWEHMIERDFDAAWGYYTPGFRQVNPQEEFSRDMARRPVRWLEAELLGLDCDDELCDVVVSLVYQAAGAPAGLSRMRVPTRTEERWINIDNQWWFVAN